MRRTRSAVAVVALVLGLLSMPLLGRAEWPMARHDPKRTGAATVPSDIQAPIAYWRHYLGGALGPAGLAVVEVDGEMAAILIAGGQAVAKRASDEVLWRSEPLQLERIAGVADLDGDGANEVVVQAAERVLVLDVATGAIRWAQGQGQMGTIGAVRLADLDGDGVTDLLVAECPCCSVTTGQTGYAYAFVGGFSAPSVLWELPSVACGVGKSLTVFDGDGAGPPEILLGGNDDLILLDGASGAELARLDGIGPALKHAHCTPAVVDAGPGQALICAYTNKALEGERSVFALRASGAPSPSLAMLWRAHLGDGAGEELVHVDLAADIGGDPRPEVLVSARGTSGVWQTHVLDAATGLLVQTLPNQRVAGTVALADGGRALVTSDASGMRGWRRSGGAVQPLWTLPGASPVTTHGSLAAQRVGVTDALLSARAAGDGSDVLIVQDSWNDTRRLRAVQVDSAGATIVAEYNLSPFVELLAAWPIAEPAQPATRLAVARSDGYLTFLGRGLTPVTPGDDVWLPGIRTGGYYASGGFRQLRNTPRVARLGSEAAASVLVVDSRGALSRWDAELASFAAPPVDVWTRPHSTAPAVLPAGGDQDEATVACLRKDVGGVVPTFEVALLDAAGSELWSRAVPNEPLNDLVWGHFNDDRRPDLALQWGDPGDVLLRTLALDGSSGALLWESDAIDPGAGRQPSGLAVGRVDGDDVDDLYDQAAATRILDGRSGAQLAASPKAPSYFMPSLVDLDGDGRDEVILHGGLQPVRVLDDDLTTTLWQSPEDERPFPYGAVTSCEGGRWVLAQGSLRYNARLRLVELGEGIGAASDLWLSGGQGFDSVAAADAAGVVRGQLTSATAHRGLSGDGSVVVLVGSTDGWLYGVDPCAGELRFSVPFGAAVGEAVSGDTDGDGRAEILVTVADGYLYNLRNFELDAPAWVWETDPHDSPPVDLSNVTARDRLHATWAPVTDATGYEVAVVDFGRRYLTSPPWQPVGNTTSTTIEGLALRHNELHYVAVRAVRGQARSVDTVSDGVVVRFPGGSDGDGGPGGGADDGGAPGACGCSGGPGGAGGIALGLLTLAALRRRPRARGR